MNANSDSPTPLTRPLSRCYPETARFRCENTAMPPRDCGKAFVGPLSTTHCPMCGYVAIPLSSTLTTATAGTPA